MGLTDLIATNLLQAAGRKSGTETSEALLRRLRRIDAGMATIEACDELHSELERISLGIPAIY